MREYQLEIVDSLAAVPAEQWDALTGGNPTLCHAFLQSMIDAGCTTAQSGWLPQFLLLRREAEGRTRLTGAVPLYVKGHSYGEYVFDWAWAEAYQRAGLDYYPKLLAAVPFTPCGGTRLMAETDSDRQILIEALLTVASEQNVSSLHVLFPSAAEHQALTAAGMMSRIAVQFHWRNAGYRSFEDFLATMSHDKRKKIKQERKKVAAAGIVMRRNTGDELTEADWDFFYRCYQRTYRAHHSTPYLNREFFGLLAERMPENILLVQALRDGQPIAASFNLFGADAFYGRYWGSSEFHSGLHFETCYYQTLEFCIERGIALFEGGAQGEHKLARGFLPVKCHSAHWLRDARFAHAVEDYLQRESGGLAQYVDELNEHGPFRKENTAVDAELEIKTKPPV